MVRGVQVQGPQAARACEEPFFLRQPLRWLALPRDTGGTLSDPADNTAASFPGVPAAEVPSIVEQLRNAAKDLLQPTVPFMHHALQGPLAAISLPAGRSIIVVRIPEGASTPYVHNDGRVYVRTGDSSSPIPANDRATLDLLHRKREEKTSLLRSLVDRRPEVSKAEGEVGYLHLIVCSDPFQVLGHRYGGSYSDFCAVMAASPLPFDSGWACTLHRTDSLLGKHETMSTITDSSPGSFQERATPSLPSQSRYFRLHSCIRMARWVTSEIGPHTHRERGSPDSLVSVISVPHAS